VSLSKKYINSKKLLPLLLDEASPLLKKEADENKEEMGKSLKVLLLEGKRTRPRIKKKSKKLNFLGLLIHHYTEISDSLENMKVGSVLVNQALNNAVLKKNKINKAKILRYHIENYLNEAYIFRDRIIKFLDWIMTELLVKNQHYEDLINKQKEKVKNSFKQITDVRGSHVHHRRFQDGSLEQLDYIYLLLSQEKKDEFSNTVKFIELMTYKKTRKKWFKIIVDNNNEAEKLIDGIFEIVKFPIFQHLYPGKRVNSQS